MTETASNNPLADIIEALLFVNKAPLSMNDMQKVLSESDSAPDKQTIETAIEQIAEKYRDHSCLRLCTVASGVYLQVKSQHAYWISKLFAERPPRYSRALFETLALIAYRQPISRAEIEDVRGVSVNSNTIKTLLEREWIKVIGHKELPGKPALFGTTKQFLDDLNLSSLSMLPPLPEIVETLSQETGDENIPAEMPGFLDLEVTLPEMTDTGEEIETDLDTVELTAEDVSEHIAISEETEETLI